MWTRDFAAAAPAGRTVLQRFGPVALGLGTLQLNTFLDTLIAMWPTWVGPTILGAAYPLDEASNVILSLTARLYQFPLGVFGIAIASAAFPLLARHADNPPLFIETLRRGIRLSLFVGLPASAGLVLVRSDITSVLFGHGSKGFSVEGLERSAAVLLGFAPAVWAYSLNHVLTRGFYARGDTRTPMRVSIAVMLLNLGLNVSLIWWRPFRLVQRGSYFHQGALSTAGRRGGPPSNGIQMMITDDDH
jgi:putative peptidoglycan lipid II flippase